MLKYLYTKVVFAEVPGEISLGISISGCQIHCKGCHSRDLWEDKGTPLNIKELDRLLSANKGVSCLLLLGGEQDMDSLIELFMYSHKKIKTAWYCGLDMIPKDKIGIMQYLDFLKVGHYDSELGGLNSQFTNQVFYKIDHQADGSYQQTDLTHRFFTK